MLSALRKAGQVKLGSTILSTNAALIKNQEFLSLLSDKVPNLKILNATFLMPNDKRDKDVQYREARIPGAQFFDIDQIADKTIDLPHMIPPLPIWTDHMKKFDIGVNDTVICYDDFTILGASRAWWTLKLFGVKNCWILNSNLAKWKSEGGPVEEGRPSANDKGSLRPAGDFNFNFNNNLILNLKDIKTWMNKPGKEGELIDARSPGRFAGSEPDPRGLASGHIPGSKNLFFKNLLNEDMCFKSDEEIATEIANSGIDLEKNLWFTCGSGVTASVLYAGFYQVGLQKTAIYDGSWSEWASDQKNPIGVLKNAQ